MPVNVTWPPAFAIVSPPAVLSIELTEIVPPAVDPEDKFKDLPFVLIGELMLMVAEEELPESIIVLSTRLMLETELPRLIGCPVVFKVPARIKLPVPAIAVTPLVKVVKLLAFLPKETPAVFVKVVAVSTAVLFWKLTA